MNYVVRPERFAALETEWWELLEWCRTDSFFLTPAWQQAWTDGLLHGEGYQPLAVRLDGDLVGLALLRRTGERLSFAADPDLCDYLDLLAAQGHEEEIWRALLDHLEEEPWQVMDLIGIPGGSPTLEVLPACAREKGYEVRLEPWDVSPRTELPATWDDYLGGLRKKDRHELRRKMRRLAEAGELHYSLVEAEDNGLNESLGEFFRLMRISREEKAKFLSEEREEFFRNMARSMARQGYLKLFLMELDQKPVSAVLGFTYGDEFLLYNSGYDTDYASLSVGLLLKAYCVDYSIRHEKRYFDFLRGDEAYKYHLGGADRSIHRCLVFRGEGR